MVASGHYNGHVYWGFRDKGLVLISHLFARRWLHGYSGEAELTYRPENTSQREGQQAGGETAGFARGQESPAGVRDKYNVLSMKSPGKPPNIFAPCFTGQPCWYLCKIHNKYVRPKQGLTADFTYHRRLNHSRPSWANDIYLLKKSIWISVQTTTTWYTSYIWFSQNDLPGDLHKFKKLLTNRIVKDSFLVCLCSFCWTQFGKKKYIFFFIYLFIYLFIYFQIVFSKKRNDTPRIIHIGCIFSWEKGLKNLISYVFWRYLQNTAHLWEEQLHGTKKQQQKNKT